MGLGCPCPAIPIPPAFRFSRIGSDTVRFCPSHHSIRRLRSQTPLSPQISDRLRPLIARGGRGRGLVPAVGSHFHIDPPKSRRKPDVKNAAHAPLIWSSRRSAWASTGYRFYSAFIAAKVLSLDDSRKTPPTRSHDGANYYPRPDGALRPSFRRDHRQLGPLLDLRPGGAVRVGSRLHRDASGRQTHDMIALWASTQRGGRSLAKITRASSVARHHRHHRDPCSFSSSRSPVSGTARKALADSAWGAFLRSPRPFPSPCSWASTCSMGPHHGSDDRLTDDSRGHLRQNVNESAFGDFFRLSHHQLRSRWASTRRRGHNARMDAADAYCDI